MRKIIYFALLTILISSCQKKDQTITNNNDDAKAIKNEVQSNFSADDFAVFGEVHNQGLDFMAKNENISTLTHFERYTLSQQFVYEDWISEEPMSFEFLELNLNYLNEIYSDPSTAANRMVDDGKISAEVEDYVNRINMVYSYILSQGKLEIMVSPDEFNDLISEIENDIIAEGIEYDCINLTGDWKAGLMVSCSIAKSSYLYWYEASNDSNHPWNFAVNGNSTKGKVWDKVKEIGGKLKDDVITSCIAYEVMRSDGYGRWYSFTWIVKQSTTASGF